MPGDGGELGGQLLLSETELHTAANHDPRQLLVRRRDWGAPAGGSVVSHAGGSTVVARAGIRLHS
jgi:hypothetical protein